jgi:hypothetical protein
VFDELAADFRETAAFMRELEGASENSTKEFAVIRGEVLRGGR